MDKPAFRLRKATLADFSDFYNFHIHQCYHWLFNDELATEEDNPFDVTFDVEDNYFFCKEDLERIHREIIDFDIHEFENYLKWYKIFMIIVEDKVVGFVKFENYCKQFIIRGWVMHYDYMDPLLLEALLEKFETYAPKKSNVIQVIAMGRPLARNFLEAHGYHARIIPFFEKSCNQKSSE